MNRYYNIPVVKPFPIAILYQDNSAIASLLPATSFYTDAREFSTYIIYYSSNSPGGFSVKTVKFSQKPGYYKITLKPAQIAPAPGSSAPVQNSSALIRNSSALVQHSPAPVQNSSAPVQHSSALVQHSSAPVQHNSAPVQHSSAPVNNCTLINHKTV